MASADDFLKIFQFATGVLGGFGAASARERQQRRAEQLQVMQLMQSQGERFAPVSAADVEQPSGFFQRAFGTGEPRQRSTGRPVFMVGQSAFAPATALTLGEAGPYRAPAVPATPTVRAAPLPAGAATPEDAAAELRSMGVEPWSTPAPTAEPWQLTEEEIAQDAVIQTIHATPYTSRAEGAKLRLARAKRIDELQREKAKRYQAEQQIERERVKENIERITKESQEERIAQRKEKAELTKAKIAMIKDLTGIDLPEGTRDRIRQAESHDALLEVMAAIRGGLKLGSVTAPQLALAAARGDSDANKALSLLSGRERYATIAALAKAAAAGDQDAARAIAILKELRATGVEPKERKEKGKHRDEPVPSSKSSGVPDPTATQPYHGVGGGTPLPQIKSFRRVQ